MRLFAPSILIPALFFSIFMVSLGFAEIDQDELHSCLCVAGCGKVSWDCSAVACYYNPAAVDASPDCADTAGGECVCQGYGCGRAPMPAAGSAEYDTCMSAQTPATPPAVDHNQQCIDQYGQYASYDSYSESCTCVSGYSMSGNGCAPIQGVCDYHCGYGEVEAPYPDCSCIPGTCKNSCGSDEVQAPYPGCSCTSGTVCGNGDCESGETAQNCPRDCSTCGNGVCESSKGETAQTCPDDCSEICYDGIDNDDNGYIDCQDGACTNNPYCGPLKGRVYFKDTEGDRMLPEVHMLARWVTEDGTQQESTQYFYTNKKGEYEFDDSDLHQPGTHNVQVLALLNGFSGKISITDSGTPIQQITDITPSSWAGGAPQDVVFQDYNEKEDTHPRDGAKFYFHENEYASFAANILSQIGIDDGIGAEMTQIHYGSPGETGAWHTRHDSPQAGTYYKPGTSSYLNMEAPGNREYHEYSHHLMNQVYGGMPNRHTDDTNHGGIDNGCSGDAYVEGFAEFTSLVVSGQTGIARRCSSSASASTYCWAGTGSDLEKNYQATKDEEFAAAGILWDLYDDSGMNGGSDDDSVSTSYDKLWKTITKERDFDSYYTGDFTRRHISYVKDLYDALMEDKYDQAGVDAIFKSHGYYFVDNTGTAPTTEYGVTLWKENSADGLYHYSNELNSTDGNFFRRY